MLAAFVASLVAQAFAPPPEGYMSRHVCGGRQLGLSPDGAIVVAVESGAVRWRSFGDGRPIDQWPARSVSETVRARGDLGRAMFDGEGVFVVQFPYETSPTSIPFTRSIDVETLAHWRIVFDTGGEASFEVRQGAMPGGFGPSVGFALPETSAFEPWRSLGRDLHPIREAEGGPPIDIMDIITAPLDEEGRRLLIQERRGEWPMEAYPLQGGALVAAFNGADTRGLLRIAPSADGLAITDVMRRPDADVREVAVAHGGTPLWVEFAAPIPQYQPLSEAGAALLVALEDLGSPLRYHLLGASEDGMRALVHVSDLHHARVMEIDVAAGRISEALRCRGEPSDGRRIEAIEFDMALEGVTLPGLHSRDPDHDSLLVHIPGGPHVVWGLALEGAALHADARGFDTLQLSYPGALGRGRAYQDAGAMTQHIVARAQCEAIGRVRARYGYDRVIVLGASYGGLLAGMMAKRGCAAVDGYGLLGGAYAPLLDGQRAAGEPAPPAAYGEDGDHEALRYWREFAPLLDRSRIEAPVLVHHGTRDAVAPFADARAFVEANRQAGAPIALCAVDRDHNDMTYGEAVEFFDRLAAMPDGDWRRAGEACMARR
jgi:pimeloyl-ACP methyl ester carboxylesterase